VFRLLFAIVKWDIREMLPHQLIYQSIVTVIKDRLGMRHRRGYHCACMTLYSSESLVKYRLGDQRRRLTRDRRRPYHLHSRPCTVIYCDRWISAWSDKLRSHRGRDAAARCVAAKTTQHAALHRNMPHERRASETSPVVHVVKFAYDTWKNG